MALILWQYLLTLLVICSAIFYVVNWLILKQFGQIHLPNELIVTSGGVSLLIPVRGLDEEAATNWHSLCQQNHPCYEVLFGVMEPDDRAFL